MKNRYIFIIWNKALWCKDKIINDLSSSFSIIKQFYIKWDEDKINANLCSLYGRKIISPKTKASNVGKEKFLFILVDDKKETFESRKMFDSTEIVNSHIYDKKNLYRLWTAGAHRIHCSDTKEETLHDLVILFGPNYKKIIDKCENNTTLFMNTKSVNGFETINDIIKSLKLFGQNIIDYDNNHINILSKSREDIIYFLNLKNKINDNQYLLNIGNKNIKISIIGEIEGEIPINLFKTTKQNNLNNIVQYLDVYLSYIYEKKKINKKLLNLYKSNNIVINDSMTKKEKYHISPIVQLFLEIKLFIFKLRYILFNK